MSVKIFLPTNYFYAKEDCDIYGEIRINDNNTISYFVIAACRRPAQKNAANHRALRHLGHILCAAAAVDELHRCDVALSFAYDMATPNIYLLGMSIKLAQATHVHILLYDRIKLLELHETAANPVRTFGNIDGGDGKQIHTEEREEFDDMEMLYNLVRQSQTPCTGYAQRRQALCSALVSAVVGFPLDFVRHILGYVCGSKSRPIVSFVRHAIFFKHYLEWQQFRNSSKRTLNIMVDKFFGICIMLVLLCVVSHPGDTLLETSHFVIRQVRYLLNSLQGSPVGLKLNLYLNEFLLDCFNYHVNLWAAFLDLIEPVVRQLFVPIALFGSMGLTYQIALLEDLISVMGLHAHCFHIYTAVLYKVEINGLEVLWKVVLGKRFNVLKNRVESYKYSYRQLFLATIFFTSLLFLFPTVLVYYVVFTTLRICLSIVYYILRQIRRHILEFPLHILLKFVCGNFYQKESLQLEHIGHAHSPMLQLRNLRMSVFKVNVLSSSLGRVLSCGSGVLQELNAKEHLSMKSIFNSLIRGTFESL